MRQRGYALFRIIFFLIILSIHDKRSSKKIAVARWQYSGTSQATVMGIVNGLGYNPALKRYWLIDARIDQPDQDGNKKYQPRGELYFVLF